MSNALTHHEPMDWYSAVPRSIFWHTLIGVFMLVFFIGGFAAWSFTAPLAAAVISSGTFVATGQNKQIQHYEGGIVKEILVQEGERVQKAIQLFVSTKPSHPRTSDNWGSSWRGWKRSTPVCAPNISG